MKKILPASLALAAVCYCTIAQAQTQPQDPTQPPALIQPQTQTPAAATAENKAPLDERFTECINGGNCSTQIRLQIIQEENDAMNSDFQKIHQTCADANFQDCIDKQKDDVQAWFTAQNNMQKMMRSMQTQPLNEKEPSAGESSSPADNGQKKTFWQKIWPFGDNNK